jgi:TPR repeat protein
MYVRGQLFPQIDARAGDWWRKFAEDADSEAKAFARLRVDAEGGDADAQTNLGLSYLTGTGTLKDRDEAAVWFGKAGKQGHLRGKCLYAALKASDADWGPRSNGAQAAETCRAAADAGDADAQRILGMLYATGRGVRKNFVESAAWTRKAAEQGRADAQYDLSYKYEKGEGVQKDKAQACAWNERAAEQGYPDALSSAAMEATMASLDDGDRCQRKGTDAKALLNSSIEYSSEDERRLFPNLWASPLNRANQQQSTDSQESIGSMMMFGMSLGLFVLAIPFVTSLVAAWAWAARGIAISAAGGLLIAAVIAFLPFSSAAAYPLYVIGARAGLIFLVWLIASVPAVIIGLAVRSIARRRTAD